MSLSSKTKKIYIYIYIYLLVKFILSEIFEQINSEREKTQLPGKLESLDAQELDGAAPLIADPPPMKLHQ